MNDPWKYLAFPLASVAGYIVAQSALAGLVGTAIGLSQILSEVVVVAVSGLIAGFLVDEVIPAYIEKVQNRRGGGADMGGGFGEDGGDLDFGEE